MICPYHMDIKQVIQDRYEYDEANVNTFHESVLVESHTFKECTMELCAAWQDGRCKYNGCGH